MYQCVLCVIFLLLLASTFVWPSIHLWLGVQIRGQIFKFEEGNNDRDDLPHPERFGLQHARNIYLKHSEDSDDMMGAWWIEPRPLEGDENWQGVNSQCTKDDCGDNSAKKLGPDDTVFILIHGNAKNRGAVHRVAAYKVWQNHGYYTLTVDYRGYGDSKLTGPMNETTVVGDAKQAIKWVRDQVGDQPKLVVYGHSLGTGVSAHAVADCEREGLAKVDGLILDSPFHSMKFGISRSKIATFVSYLIDVDRVVSEADIEFNSIKWLPTLHCPIMILHADVDHVVSIKDSEQLVIDTKLSGKDDIKLVRFPQDGLGHIGISTAEGFPEIIKQFVQELH